jgi:hypothetical protein
MEAFPFTDAEWDSLKPLADSIINAVLADDDALAASLRLDMLDLLVPLRERYGDHPVLLETIADYKDDDAEAAALYRRAVEIAEANGLPTLSIRVALAFDLMKLGEPEAALEELHACGGEAAGGSEEERADWVRTLGWTAYYTEDDAERIVLYRRAVEIAAAHGQPTLGIRLPFARFLLDIGKPAEAREELRACEGEVPGGDEHDRTAWMEHLAEANRAEPDAAPDRG